MTAGRGAFRHVREGELKNKRATQAQAAPAGKAVADAVTSKLKAYYSDIAAQDVPDRFLDLLSQLDAADLAQKALTKD